MILSLVLSLMALPAAAQQASGPAMTQLQQAAQNGSGGATTPEGAKDASSQSFSGNSAPNTAVLPTGKDINGQSYIMVGQSPVQGISIYTPRLDPTGNAKTEKAKAADLIGKKKILAAAGLGGAVIIGGILAGGPFGGILLALGGALLGAAAVLGFLRHKLNKSKAD